MKKDIVKELQALQIELFTCNADRVEEIGKRLTEIEEILLKEKK